MAKQQKPEKVKVKKEHKITKNVKESFSELKKVSWPTFGKAVAKTGAVIAVVLFFALVLFGLDRLLSWLYELLISGTKV